MTSNDGGDEKTKKRSQQEMKSLANRIAGELKESKPKPRAQILYIVLLCGPEFAESVLRETLQIEEQGGMMIKSGTRRRTPGGVFFHLARRRMPEDIRQRIFLNWQFSAEQQAKHEAKFPVFDWDDRQAILQEALAHKGEASEVKVNITGRPGTIERRQHLVILTMENQINPNLALPSGLPDPPAEPMSYVIYISAKQWERVAVALEKPKDEFIIDGLCAYDDELGSLAIYTTYITTRYLMRKEKQQAKQQSDKENSKKRKSAESKPAAKNSQTDSAQPAKKSSGRKPKDFDTPRAQSVKVDISPGVPPEIARKLMELYTAAASFQQKIAMLEDKPAGQQHGLEMTQKLLKNTQRQIEVLEKQYNSSN